MAIRQIPTFKLIWISFFALLFLNACSTVSGNVVPKSGPKMEKVYDSMSFSEEDKNESNQIPPEKRVQISGVKSGVKDFKKIPNPELPLYIYPPFAGQEQVPVPGYFTGFSGYERNFYGING